MGLPAKFDKHPAGHVEDIWLSDLGDTRIWTNVRALTACYGQCGRGSLSKAILLRELANVAFSTFWSTTTLDDGGKYVDKPFSPNCLNPTGCDDRVLG
jgi:hypothetical protein